MVWNVQRPLKNVWVEVIMISLYIDRRIEWFWMCFLLWIPLFHVFIIFGDFLKFFLSIILSGQSLKPFWPTIDNELYRRHNIWFKLKPVRIVLFLIDSWINSQLNEKNKIGKHRSHAWKAESLPPVWIGSYWQIETRFCYKVEMSGNKGFLWLE